MDMEGLDEIVELFKSEVTERLSRVEEELINNQGKDIESIYREFHTIKGTSQMLGFENYSKAAHLVEDIVKPLWKQNLSLPENFIPRLLNVLDVFRKKLGKDMDKEDLEKIESILKGEEEGGEKREIALEIVTEIDRDLLEKTLHLSEQALFHSFRNYQEDGILLKLLNEIVDDLRDIYWKVETVPLKDILKGFDRLVFEEAAREGKKVRLEVDVQDVRVKKEIAGPIRDGLVHIVKNSIVHGIEKPEERKESGKNEEGVVRILARVEGRKVYISVEDDGKGIDFEKVRAKLKALGKPVPEEEEKLLSVIFEPFFSTKETADLGGGRGVGLSSVKTFIESIGGRVEVHTLKGRGTRFTIEIKSTKVWERVMILRSGILTYAVRVPEIEKITTYSGEEMCRFTGQIVVKLTNGSCFRCDTKITDGEFVVIENPFFALENVRFWVDFLGMPVPVFQR